MTADLHLVTGPISGPICVCGDPKEAHEHFNRLSYCGFSNCGCRRYHEKKFSASTQETTIMTLRTPAKATANDTVTVERKGGGMPKWAFFKPYHSDINGQRFLTRFIFFFTPYGGAHITRIHMADDQRKWPHDHSADFISIRLAGGYEEDVYGNPYDLSSVRHRVHRWLSASRLTADEAHSITSVKPFTVTLLLLGRRRNHSAYWTPNGTVSLGMTLDLDNDPAEW